MSITGEPGRGPMRVGIPIADLSAGLYAAIGILVALLERESVRGSGQWVQSSLLQAMIAQLDFQAARYLFEGTAPGQAGNDHPTSIPTGVFETADGHINIATSGGAIYERLCEALEMPDLITDPQFATGQARSENRAALNDRINRRTRTQAERRLGGGAQPGGRALRADPCHRRDVRRPASAPPRHGRAGRAPDPRAHAHRLPGDAAQPHAVQRCIAATPELGAHSDEILARARLRCGRDRGFSGPWCRVASTPPCSTRSQMPGSAMIDQLLVETAGPVGWITFNNPAKHNALSVAMWRALPGKRSTGWRGTRRSA